MSQVRVANAEPCYIMGYISNIYYIYINKWDENSNNIFILYINGFIYIILKLYKNKSIIL